MMEELTLKQRMFVRYYLDSKSATQAAYYAYRCKSMNVAGVIGYENLRKPNIRVFLDGVLDRAGLTDEQMVKSVSNLIEKYPCYQTIKMVLKLKGYPNI